MLRWLTWCAFGLLLAIMTMSGAGSLQADARRLSVVVGLTLLLWVGITLVAVVVKVVQWLSR